MGSSSGGTSTQKSEPWGAQQDYLKYGFGQAQQQYQSDNPQYYPGQTVAPLSPVTQTAMALQAQRAIQGSPLQNAANNMAANTMAGSYMNANPYLNQNFNTGARQITNAYNNAIAGSNASAVGSGRYGSGMQAFQKNQANDTLAQNLNELYGQTYGANYDNERTNQMRAMAFTPQMLQADYQNLNALSDVGNAQDQYNQSLIDADINKWNYNQNLGANKLGQYMGMINGNYGGTSTMNTPTSSNMFGNIMSGLGTGAALFSAFSDARLKEDIKRIGYADNGLPLYSFRYIGDSEPRVGLMAQDVEAVKPDAVTEHHTGFKMVDYRMALEV